MLCRGQQPPVALPGPQCSLSPSRRPEPAVHLHNQHLCCVRQLGGTRHLLVSAHRYGAEVRSRGFILNISWFIWRCKWFCAAVHPMVIKWVGTAEFLIPCRGSLLAFLSDWQVMYFGFPILTTLPVAVTCGMYHWVQVSRAAIILSLSPSKCVCQVYYTDKW